MFFVWRTAIECSNPRVWGWLPGAGIGDTPAWWWAAAAVVVVVVGWLVGAPLLRAWSVWGISETRMSVFVFGF